MARNMVNAAHGRSNPGGPNKLKTRKRTKCGRGRAGIKGKGAGRRHVRASSNRTLINFPIKEGPMMLPGTGIHVESLIAPVIVGYLVSRRMGTVMGVGAGVMVWGLEFGLMGLTNN